MPKSNYNKIIFSLLCTAVFIFPKLSQAADVNASASRTSGVAPLSVHFNADLTASSPTERSFHDLEYSWNFGDTNAGNWGTDGTPKNTDKGPISAHVYEAPGIYTVTLNVRNETDIIDTRTFQITATDPEVVFAGTKTTCLSTGTDWTGCPSGAGQVTADDLSGIGTYADAGERLLLRRGDFWTQNTDVPFPDNAGPVHIGAFGSCVNPNNQGICENAPEITMTGGDQFIAFNNKQDWRISDISFSAAKTVSSAIGGGLGLIKDILISRIETTGFTNPVGWTHWKTNDSQFIEDMAIVSSKMTSFGGTGIYIGSEHLAFMGNIVQNSDTTHVCRIWQAYQGTINHNILSGSSLTNSNGRHALKLHGSTPYGLPNGETFVGTYAQAGGGGLRQHTQFVVISGNVFGSSGPWPVSVGPQDGAHDERTSDIVFEKNRFVADYGAISPTPVRVGIMVEGRYATIRNNIFDGKEDAGEYIGVSITRRGVEWAPLGNRVYNNTIYTAEINGNETMGVTVHADASDTEISNNFISFPNATGPKINVLDYSGNAIISTNTLTNTPYFTDPDNANPLLRNFSLTSNSVEAIDQGTIIPVLDDFAGTYRTGTYDIGAFNYDSGDVTAPAAPYGLNVL